jgi:glycosyltransferase involved in cell wall biosynthesis
VKIAFLFGEFLVGHRPLDFNVLFTSKRGLSGSDLGVSRAAQEFAKQGHDVSLFTVHCPNKPDVWEGVKLYDIKDKTSIIKSDWDAIISWCEPDAFRDLPSEPIRVCSQQLNDFTYCKEGFDDFVDIWASPSEGHFKHHAHQTPKFEKWVVVPDGCDPALYTPGKKVRGRVVHISSPDRGMHWLLSEWQNIKKRVPEAHLRTFYHCSQGDVKSFEKGFKDRSPYFICPPSIMELGQRMRYLDRAMTKLEPLGVQRIGSVSRDEIVEELDQAMVLGYPASMVNNFCEGFSCSIMEACAAGCVPVISDVDALGELYGGAAPMIHMPKPPAQPDMKQFTDLVVKSLTDDKWIEEITKKCQALAAKYTWKLATDKYIKVIQGHPKYKGNK